MFWGHNLVPTVAWVHFLFSKLWYKILGSCRNLIFHVFMLFLARFSFLSSFFSKSRLCTRPLFSHFVTNLDWLAGQPIQIFFGGPDFCVLFQIFYLFLCWVNPVGDNCMMMKASVASAPAMSLLPLHHDCYRPATLAEESAQKRKKKAEKVNFYLRHNKLKKANLDQVFSGSRSGTIAHKNKKRITTVTHYQLWLPCFLAS